jgi:ubiquitin-conjugating enzyme E2 G1
VLFVRTEEQKKTKRKRKKRDFNELFLRVKLNMSDQAVLLLRNQLRDLTRNPIEGFSAGLVNDSNILQWQVTIMGPPDTLYEGGFFTATMTFPRDYPNKPPDVKFKSEMWHPNVYPDGRVCISILHDAGEDPMGYERASERWSPVQTVETIMLSIISMLSSPNDESPANIDAAKQFREDYPGFKKRVSKCVRKSQEDCF